MARERSLRHLKKDLSPFTEIQKGSFRSKRAYCCGAKRES